MNTRFKNKNISAIAKHIANGGIVIMNYEGFLQINKEVYYAYKDFVDKTDNYIVEKTDMLEYEKVFLDAFNEITLKINDIGKVKKGEKEVFNFDVARQKAKYVVIFKDEGKIFIDYCNEIDNSALKKTGCLKYKDNKIKIGLYKQDNWTCTIQGQ